MNKDNAKEYLPLVQALAEGKVIEIKSYYGEWITRENVNFDVAPKKYRIKEEPKYVPFTFEDRELFKGKWIKPKENKNELMVTKIYEHNNSIESFNNSFLTFQKAFTDWEFVDGSVFGKLQQ